jgi:hypothetical protein
VCACVAVLTGAAVDLAVFFVRGFAVLALVVVLVVAVFLVAGAFFVVVADFVVFFGAAFFVAAAVVVLGLVSLASFYHIVVSKPVAIDERKNVYVPLAQQVWRRRRA